MLDSKVVLVEVVRTILDKECELVRIKSFAVSELCGERMLEA